MYIFYIKIDVSGRENGEETIFEIGFFQKGSYILFTKVTYKIKWRVENFKHMEKSIQTLHKRKLIITLGTMKFKENNANSYNSWKGFNTEKRMSFQMQGAYQVLKVVKEKNSQLDLLYWNIKTSKIKEKNSKANIM